jgi:hypothetical protein
MKILFKIKTVLYNISKYINPIMAGKLLIDTKITLNNGVLQPIFGFGKSVFRQ